MNRTDIDALNQRFDQAPAQEVLQYFVNELGGEIALATSMGAEDQVLTHMMAQLDKPGKVFTLDTGRLHQDTYELLDTTRKKYKLHIRTYFPETEAVEAMVNSKGINLFYDSVENRRLCCGLRKIAPLRRALKGLTMWVTGLRSEQSVTRIGMQMVEWDEGHGLMKLNPLIHWTEKEVWDYLKLHNVPYNRLHDKGFPSIGCEPCTRAIAPDEDVRAGRWWWENPDTKECGLHARKLK